MTREALRVPLRRSTLARHLRDGRSSTCRARARRAVSVIGDRTRTGRSERRETREIDAFREPRSRCSTPASCCRRRRRRPRRTRRSREAVTMPNDIACTSTPRDVTPRRGITSGERFVGDRWMWSTRSGRRRRCASTQRRCIDTRRTGNRRKISGRETIRRSW